MQGLTEYGSEPPGIAVVGTEGAVLPVGNGATVLDVGAVGGFDKKVRVRVIDVFPEVTFVGRQFDHASGDDVVLAFSEPIDRGRLNIAQVEVVDDSSQPVSGTTSTSPDGLHEADEIVFTYNFFTDEIEQGQPFDDFFRVKLVLPDGSERTVLVVSRDTIRFSSQTSPVPGFDRMTGFRTARFSVAALGGQLCHVVFDTVISDEGDASIDSAVLLDDLHFE